MPKHDIARGTGSYPKEIAFYDPDTGDILYSKDFNTKKEYRDWLKTKESQYTIDDWKRLKNE